MTFGTQAPGVGAGRAEKTEVIKQGIAARGLVFKIIKDLLQTHDAGGLEVTAMAQRAGKQSVSKVLLRGRHVCEGQTLAFHGNEVPVHPFVGVHVKARLGFLFRRQGCEEIVRCICHLESRRLREECRVCNYDCQQCGEKKSQL